MAGMNTGHFFVNSKIGQTWLLNDRITERPINE